MLLITKSILTSSAATKRPAKSCRFAKITVMIVFITRYTIQLSLNSLSSVRHNTCVNKPSTPLKLRPLSLFLHYIIITKSTIAAPSVMPRLSKYASRHKKASGYYCLIVQRKNGSTGLSLIYFGKSSGVSLNQKKVVAFPVSLKIITANFISTIFSLALNSSLLKFIARY